MILVAWYFPWRRDRWYQLIHIKKRRLSELQSEQMSPRDTHNRRAKAKYRIRSSSTCALFAHFPSWFCSASWQMIISRHREIVTHQLDREFKVPIAMPIWRLRSVIGQHFRLHRNIPHEENYNVYQVQPTPEPASALLRRHFIIKMPNDRRLDESLVLMAKKELHPAQRSDRCETGSENKCGPNLGSCLIYIHSGPIHPNHPKWSIDQYHLFPGRPKGEFSRIFFIKAVFFAFVLWRRRPANRK